MLQGDADGPTLGESLANAHSVGKLKKKYKTPNYSIKITYSFAFISYKNYLDIYYLQKVGYAWKKIHPCYELELKGSWPL